MSVPPPATLALLAATPFVGREEDLATLETAWAAAGDGRPRLVLVGGEPGIGKTRLLAEFARLLDERRAPVLYGRADETAPDAYGAIREALADLAAVAPVADLREITVGAGRVLGGVLPVVQRRLRLPADTATHDIDRAALFDAVTSLVRVASVRAPAPAALLLDDLHWVGEPTLELLRHLIRGSGGALPLVVVGTYRDSELDVARPLADALADLRREPGVERIALRGLHEEEVTDLAGMVGGYRAREQAPAIAEETRGNPFFVVELSRLIEADGGAGRVPESIREVVSRRVNRLPADVQHLLRAGSVLGPQWDVSTAGEISGADDEAALDAAEAAQRAALVEEDRDVPGRYAFSHAIVRTTLYDSLSAPRRARLHAAAAVALDGERLPAEVANHLLRSGDATLVPAAAEHLRRAAERAISVLAWEDAAEHCTTALESLDVAGGADLRLSAELLVLRGMARDRAGEYLLGRDDLLAGGSLAIDVGAIDLVARAATAISAQRSRTAEAYGDDIDAFLDAALRCVSDIEPANEARVLAAVAGYRVFTDPLGAREAAARAVALARACGDQAVLASALAAQVWASPPFQPDGLDRAATELEPLARTVGDEYALWFAEFARMWAALDRGDRSALERALGGFRQIAQRARAALLTFYVAYCDFCLHISDGDTAAAGELLAPTLEAGRRGMPPEMFEETASGALFMLLFVRGELEAAEPVLAATTDAAPQRPMWWSVRALVAAMSGHHADARTRVATLGADGFAGPLIESVELGINIFAMSLATALSDARGTARTLYCKLEPRADLCSSYPMGLFLGSNHFYLGLLAGTEGRLEVASEHLEEALRRHEAFGSPMWIANTEDALGAVRAAMGDAEAGTALRERAAKGAAEYGFVIPTSRWALGPR